MIKLSKIMGLGRSAPISLIEKVGAGVRAIRMSYDAAQTTEQNENHWSATDELSADAANSEAVRKILRERTRYEVGSNSYAAGIVDTKVNDVVGRGPRIQVRSGDDELDDLLESEFTKWAEKDGLAEKCRIMRKAAIKDGEGFILFAWGPPTTENPFDPASKHDGVRLTLRVIEADQVATPGLYTAEQSGRVSGIEFDTYGHPKAYHILKEHPGDLEASSFSPEDKKTVPASDIIHFFKAERPGQSRGIPELTPALPLLAQMRRWTLATITAAENLANVAFTIQTTAPADGEAAATNPMESIPMTRGEALVLPEGWTLGQPKSEQPVSTYAAFKAEILNEFARCIGMPYNIAAGNSSNYNYASGRLDHQGYYKSNRIDQDRMEKVILNRTWARWFREAIATPNYLPQKARQISTAGKITVRWFWDGTEHVDPLKEANAQAVRLSSHTTTLAIECAKNGYDHKDIIKQRGEEIKLLREAGLLTAGVPIEEEPEEPDDGAGDNTTDDQGGKEAPAGDAQEQTK